MEYAKQEGSDMDTIATDYAEAYFRVHGSKPSVEMNGDRYSIVTKTGFFAKFTRKDVLNLTRALKRLAK